jgi:hypothetical protein
MRTNLSIMRLSHFSGSSALAREYFQTIMTEATIHPFVHVQALPGTPHEAILLMLLNKIIQGVCETFPRTIVLM